MKSLLENKMETTKVFDVFNKNKIKIGVVKATDFYRAEEIAIKMYEKEYSYLKTGK